MAGVQLRGGLDAAVRLRVHLPFPLFPSLRTPLLPAPAPSLHCPHRRERRPPLSPCAFDNCVSSSLESVALAHCPAEEVCSNAILEQPYLHATAATSCNHVSDGNDVVFKTVDTAAKCEQAAAELGATYGFSNSWSNTYPTGCWMYYTGKFYFNAASSSTATCTDTHTVSGNTWTPGCVCQAPDQYQTCRCSYPPSPPALPSPSPPPPPAAPCGPVSCGAVGPVADAQAECAGLEPGTFCEVERYLFQFTQMRVDQTCESAAGTEPIPTYAACKHAVEFQGQTLQPEISSTTAPGGCLQDDFTSMYYFNSNLESGVQCGSASPSGVWRCFCGTSGTERARACTCAHPRRRRPRPRRPRSRRPSPATSSSAWTTIRRRRRTSPRA